MNIQLIQGEFNSNDALELITQLIHVKIKYHENKINANATEEDITKKKHDYKKSFTTTKAHLPQKMLRLKWML